MPLEKRNWFSRGFYAGYGGVERWYVHLVGSMTRQAGMMVILALLMGGGVYGLARLPTGFLPLEDQGYL